MKDKMDKDMAYAETYIKNLEGRIRRLTKEIAYLQKAGELLANRFQPRLDFGYYLKQAKSNRKIQAYADIATREELEVS